MLVKRVCQKLLRFDGRAVLSDVISVLQMAVHFLTMHLQVLRLLLIRRNVELEWELKFLRVMSR